MWWWPLLGCGVAHRYPDGGGLEGQFEREVVALSIEKKRLEAELAACGRPGVEGAEGADPLALELTQVFAGSEVEVRREEGSTVLVVRAAHLWSDPYGQVFRAEARSTVDLLATAIGLHPDHRVWIVGHTADRPPPEAQLERSRDLLWLSTGWAASLTAELQRGYGLDVARIGIGGRGPHAPVRSNDVEEGRAANERLEIWLAPASSPVLPR